MAYQTLPGYAAYPQPYPQPYQDRLAQLQNQYQQTIPQQQIQQIPQQQPINQGLLWVQGEAAARSYLVAPNSTVLLMDSDANRFYLKSADNAGMPNLRTFEYSEVSQNAPQPSQTPLENLDDKYVTRGEYEALQAKYADILEKLNSFRDPAWADESTKRSAAKGSTGRGKGGNADGESTV